MSDVAIRVEGLGKQYHLGGNRETYSTLRDQFRKWTSLQGLLRRAKHTEHRPPFWALKDVSFEIKQGEVVGIIGRNGAGKSTLLKILSRITEPTEGGADIHGRVGSLLEVGTGFHPELTGRENVYLNGAIMGMSRVEIVRKFDEIVAFAEVERFVDTPVKHYSSGMYTRLAFAVAAHLDPDILIVDEVLAVGDAAFQKKCLGKMGEVANDGRTVLFVSHNMAAVQTLCTRCLLLEQGRVKTIGSVAEGIRKYLSTASSEGGRLTSAGRTMSPTLVQVTDGWLEVDGQVGSRVLHNQDLTVVVTVEVLKPVTFVVELALRQQNGNAVMFGSSGLLDRLQFRGVPGKYRVRCRLPQLPLAAGAYTIDVIASILNLKYLDYLESAIAFTIDSTSIGELGWNYTQDQGRGFMLWNVRYELESGPLMPLQQ